MSIIINFGPDEEFIKNYDELKSSRKMGELYGCSKSAILRHAKAINYDSNKNHPSKLTLEQKQDIIDSYEDTNSVELAEKYGVSKSLITKIWRESGKHGKSPTVRIKDDLTGRRFCRIVVLKPTDERTAGGCVKWLCKCDCGTEKTISGSDLKTGKIKSCGCFSKESLLLGRGACFKDLTGQKFGKLTVIERCENKISESGVSSVQYLCQCECGRTTKVTASNLRKGNTQSCGFCNLNSHGNLKIEQLLIEANIPFVREKRFNTCKDKAQLPFDFYVDNKYLIEYDGKQHFEDSSLFDSIGTKYHDQIKNQWCKENNIPLIRIPYTHFNELCIEDLLLDTTQFLIK